VDETPLVSGDPLIRLRGFGKRYRREQAVAGVDLEVRRGEIYGLIGPDGAGKSSLMKAVAGVLGFETGEVEVFGVRLESEAAAERIKGRIGFMPQGLGLNLYAELSVEENIDFFAQLREVPAQRLAQRKRRLLAMTRLERFRDRPMTQRSGGMKQKLGLICTLIHEPELVILDEPTTGVDPVSRRDFWAILAELLRERGITALIATAYMDEAARFHRLSLMYEGRVLAAGEPDEIRRVVPGTLVTLRATPQIEALRRLRLRYPQVEAVGPQVRVFVEETQPEKAGAAVRERLEGLELADVTAEEPELEDAFVALLRQRGLAGEATADDLDRCISEGPGLRWPATSLASHGLHVTPQEAVSALDDSFMRWRDVWKRSGFAPVRKAWMKRAWGLGERIAFTAPAGRVEGVFRGLDYDGALLLKTDEGLQGFHAGDVEHVKLAQGSA